MSQFFNSNPGASGPRRGPWSRDVPRTWKAALGLPGEDLDERRDDGAGTHRLGPADGTFSLRTGRTGAAAKAGHDLLIRILSWEATLILGDDPEGTSLTLTADGGSLRVQEGTGGMKALTEDDKADIATTIDDEILKREPITFRSTRMEPMEGGGGWSVQGDLTLLGATRPLAFDLVAGDGGRLRADAVVKQTDWGITPYSTLFGALKLEDEVTIEVEARLPAS